MKVRRRTPAPTKPRAAADRTRMGALLEDYLEWMRTRNYSDDTVRTRSNDLRRFITWCDDRSLSEPTDVTQPVVERYQRWLYYLRLPNGRALGFRTQHHLMTSLRLFFRWMTRQHLTLFNPAAEIEMPRYGRRLPRDILTAAEADAVISQPDVSGPAGIRDRAILETLYSTGVRRRELAQLLLYDLDRSRGTLYVRQGKNRKDRVIPIGERARGWIDKYVTDVRPELVVEPDEGYLFVTLDGGPYRLLSRLSEMVHKYIAAANVGKTGGCHVFRHTMATLMLENGADIRFIQEMLGHANLTATELYTHVSVQKLQQIHRATHPAEHARASTPAVDPPPSSEALLDALAAESDDDQEDALTPR